MTSLRQTDPRARDGLELELLYDEDMTPMHMTMFGAWYGGGRRAARVSKSRRRPEANSVRVPEVEAQSN